MKTLQRNFRQKNQTGQVTVEMVLLVALTVFIMAVVSKTFRDQEVFASLVSGPWKTLSGMIQNGSWGTPKDTMRKHPNQFERVSSPKGELVQ